jgi:hypothetical protein
MLRDAANHAQRNDLEILDVAEIVAARLQPKSPKGPNRIRTH